MVVAAILGLIAGAFMAWVNLSNHELHRLNTPLILNNGLVKLILTLSPLVIVVFSFIKFGIIAGIVTIAAALIAHTFVWVRAEKKMRKLMSQANKEKA